jgi:hypothetical protein
MVLANNAIYCPGATAVDVSGIGNGTFSANFIEGRLIGATIDGLRFHDGRILPEVFTDPARNDYWLRPDSVLSNHANPDFAPVLDFNHSPRKVPFDVGAYESDGRVKNSGWRVQAGFKPANRP